VDAYPEGVCWTLHGPAGDTGQNCGSRADFTPYPADAVEVDPFGDPWDEAWVDVWYAWPGQVVALECDPASASLYESVTCTLTPSEQWSLPPEDLTSAEWRFVPGSMEEEQDAVELPEESGASTRTFVPTTHSPHGGGTVQVTYEYNYVTYEDEVQVNSPRVAYLVFTGSGCGGTGIRGFSVSCTVTPYDTSYRITEVEWTFEPTGNSRVNTVERAPIAGPVASSTWAGQVVQAGNMRVQTYLNSVLVDTLVTIGITPRSEASIGWLDSALTVNTLVQANPGLWSDLGLTESVLNIVPAAVGGVTDFGPNHGYYWHQTGAQPILKNVTLRHTVSINYPQFESGSSLHLRHVSPGAGVPNPCPASFIISNTGSGLKRSVEKHEGTAWEANSHVGFARAWFADRKAGLQSRFESFVSEQSGLTNEEYWELLTNATHAAFVAQNIAVIDNGNHAVAVPNDCTLIGISPG
jgi:hypothetical protein